MPTITWDESKPGGADSLALGDNEIRSLKSSVRAGLDAEHVWPAAGGDAGVHRLGSARVYVAAQSLVSSTGTDGRLFQASNTSNLFGVGSGGTTFLGGPTVLSAGSFPGTAPQRHYWAVEFGRGALTASAVTTVTFPGSGFSGVPYMVATPDLPAGFAAAFATVVGLSATTAGVGVFDFDGNTLAVPFNWISIGSRVL